MYLYIHDAFTHNSKYEKILSQIEAKIINLEINGIVNKLNALKGVQDSIRNGLKENIKTVVAVGDDSTFFKVISAVAHFDQKLVIGYLPFGENLQVAKALGIPTNNEKSCDILSGRIIKKFDIGKVNDKFFFQSIEIPDHLENVIIETPQYSIEIQDKDAILSICNLDIENKNNNIQPGDGFLDLIIKNEKKSLFKNKKSTSRLLVKELSLKNKDDNMSVSAIIDGNEIIKTPFKIELLQQHIHMIVGSERSLFNE